MNVFDMPFSRVYSCLMQKAERKGRTRDEVDAVTAWLTGYAVDQLRSMGSDETTYGAFIDGAPEWNPRAEFITGKVCGIRVETIADLRMRKQGYARQRSTGETGLCTKKTGHSDPKTGH